MDRLAVAASVVVRQKAKLAEALTGFEQRNQYTVTDPAGGALYLALESGGSALARFFLKSLRPFEIQIVSSDKRPALSLVRPFRFYFHQLRVRDSKQRVLGDVRRLFSLLRRVYTVRDASGHELYRLYGPLLHPWTFEIRQGERVVGRIVKKWSGLAREAFTDADTFGLTFPTGADVNAKALLLGAVLLIDFVHFENSDN